MYVYVSRLDFHFEFMLIQSCEHISLIIFIFSQSTLSFLKVPGRTSMASPACGLYSARGGS